MKKFCSIMGGDVMFFTILVGMALFIPMGVIVLFIDLETGIAIIGFSLCVFGGSMILLVLTHHMNFVTVSEQGISVRKKTYSWDEIRITVDLGEKKGIAINPMYEIFFGLKYMLEDARRKVAKGDGMFMDLDKKRLDYILQYYHRPIMIVRESPYQADLLQIMKEHNKKHAE